MDATFSTQNVVSEEGNRQNIYATEPTSCQDPNYLGNRISQWTFGNDWLHCGYRCIYENSSNISMNILENQSGFKSLKI